MKKSSKKVEPYVPNPNKELSPLQVDELLGILQERFQENMGRHEGINWADVQERLEAAPDKLWSLNEMERTGGEPDIVGRDEQSGAYLFIDCSAQSPAGRRSICYDQEALEARKKAKPRGSALGMAAVMGIEMLDEEQYRALQAIEPFDSSTSSWLRTPAAVRERGGAIFGDYRFGRVFVYHNGADSYYGARGFRGALRV